MKLAACLAAATFSVALAASPAARADSKYYNVTVGGPGYAVSVGSAGWGFGLYGGVPIYPAVAPVVVPAPMYRPVYAPAPVYVAPPVVYRPYPAYRPHYYGQPVVYHRGYRPYAPVASVPYRATAPVRYVAVAPY